MSAEIFHWRSTWTSSLFTVSPLSHFPLIKPTAPLFTNCQSDSGFFCSVLIFNATFPLGIALISLVEPAREWVDKHSQCFVRQHRLKVMCWTGNTSLKLGRGRRARGSQRADVRDLLRHNMAQRTQRASLQNRHSGGTSARTFSEYMHRSQHVIQSNNKPVQCVTHGENVIAHKSQCKYFVHMGYIKGGI